MPTLKVCQLDHQIKKDGTAQILIRIIHKKKVAYVKTGYYIKPAQLKEGIVTKHPDAVMLNMAIEQKKSELLQNILKQDLNNEEINIAKAAGKRELTTATMYGAIRHVINMYEAQKKATAFRKMRINDQFLKEAWSKDIYLNDITKLDVEKFANYRYQKGNGKSTVKKNVRDLGTVLNHVGFKGHNYFYEYAKNIKAKPAQRDKLTFEEIKLLENAHLKGMYDIARDMFLFAFYAQGMRFESVATFKREYIRGEYLYYTMNKGEKSREIFIHPKLKAIIEKYINGTSLYLFPVVKEVHTIWNKKEIIGTVNAMINNFLTGAAQRCGIDKHVSSHVARHTFAYLSLKKNITTEIIKDALGHSTVKVTECYLKSLGDDAINEAVKVVYD